jgi:hypothetical protein
MSARVTHASLGPLDDFVLGMQLTHQNDLSVRRGAGRQHNANFLSSERQSAQRGWDSNSRNWRMACSSFSRLKPAGFFSHPSLVGWRDQNIKASFTSGHRRVFGVTPFLTERQERSNGNTRRGPRIMSCVSLASMNNSVRRAWRMLVWRIANGGTTSLRTSTGNIIFDHSIFEGRNRP